MSNGADLDEAIACHRAGELDRARAMYEALLKADAGQADVLNLLGVLCAQQGETDRAETLLEQAVASQPDHARAHGSLGNLRRMQGRMDAALAAYRRAAELDADNPLNQFNLASAFAATDAPDQAEAGYLRALALDPDYADAHINLGYLLFGQHRLDEASTAFEEGLSRQPDNAGVHEKLGDLRRHQGRFDAAADCFARAMEHDPKRRYLEHLVHAYRGETVATASPDYVQFLFDNFAEDYDDKLVSVLDYRAPGLLRDLLDTHVGKDVRFQRALDLGCGTGLSGKAFRDVAATLDGVDLSAAMLDRARALGVYDNLSQTGIETFLAESEHSYDLFVAADVFVYVGDLGLTFDRMRARCNPEGAHVLFSVESTEEAGYALQRNGRYAHSASYLDATARAAGFVPVHRSAVTLRTENGQPVTGYRCLLIAE